MPGTDVLGRLRAVVDVRQQLELKRDFPALGCVCKHTNQSPSGCCGGRHLERVAQEAAKTPVKPLASKNAPSRAGSVGDSLMKEAKKERPALQIPWHNAIR